MMKLLLVIVCVVCAVAFPQKEKTQFFFTSEFLQKSNGKSTMTWYHLHEDMQLSYNSIGILSSLCLPKEGCHLTFMFDHKDSITASISDYKRKTYQSMIAQSPNAKGIIKTGTGIYQGITGNIVVLGYENPYSDPIRFANYTFVVTYQLPHSNNVISE